MLFTLKPCAGGIGPSWPGAALTLIAWDVYGHMHHDVSVCEGLIAALMNSAASLAEAATSVV